MTFKRGKFWSLYVPRSSGGAVQRSTGTTDANLAKRMGRMIETLADQRRWDVLGAIDAKVVTVGAVWDAFCVNGLDALAADMQSPYLLPMVDQWIATLTRAPSTLEAYERQVRVLITDKLKAKDITAGWVVDRIAKLPHSGSTRSMYLAALTLFLDYVVAHGGMPDNPARNRSVVRRPKPNKPRTMWKSIADDLRLVNAAPEPYRTFFALVHSTGSERDAALHMIRSDVDLTTGTIRIRGTKRATRDRIGVPIEPWALPMVATVCKTLLPDAPLFPDLRRTMVNQMHKDAREAVKLDGYQLRDARHSYAVRAILRGEKLWKVARWLGHSNVKVTAEVYTQFQLQDALDMLAADPKADGGISA
jgi:integrase